MSNRTDNLKFLIKRAADNSVRKKAVKEEIRRLCMEKSAKWTAWEGLKNIARAFGFGTKGVAQIGTDVTVRGAKGAKRVAKAGYKGVRYATGAKASASRKEAQRLYQAGYNMRNASKKRATKAMADAIMRRSRWEEIPSKLLTYGGLAGLAGLGISAATDSDDGF